MHPQRLVEAVFDAHLGDQLGAGHGIGAAKNRQGRVAGTEVDGQEGQGRRAPEHADAGQQAPGQSLQASHLPSGSSQTLVNNGVLCEVSKISPLTCLR
ncbi:hypothetical protein D3C79_821860 [compost metagenome]